MNKQYVECCGCGTIHYKVTKEEADSLKASGYLVDEFSERNFDCCSNCGKSKFSEITEDYVDKYSDGDHIQPVIVDDGELKTTAKTKP